MGHLHALVLATTLAVALTFTLASAHLPWAGTEGRDFAGNLPSDFESSGVIFHPRLRKLLVVSDDGRLASVDIISGVAEKVWDLNHLVGKGYNDFECITFANATTDVIYLCNEYPYRIYEYNMAQENITRTFDLTGVIPAPKKTSHGIEAITFVQDASQPEGGLFLCGSQSSGIVYQVEIPIVSSSTSTSVRLVGSFDPRPQTHDLSGLWYSWWTDRVYVLYDTANLLLDTPSDGSSVLDTWDVPTKSTSNQEGIAVAGCGESSVVYMSQDNGGGPPFLTAWRWHIPAAQCVGGEEEIPLPDGTPTTRARIRG